MERHDTHNLSHTTSEEHTYKIDNNSKMTSIDCIYYPKEEVKYDWFKFISKSSKDYINYEIDNELININEISLNKEIKEKNPIKNEKIQSSYDEKKKEIIKEQIMKLKLKEFEEKIEEKKKEPEKKSIFLKNGILVRKIQNEQNENNNKNIINNQNEDIRHSNIIKTSQNDKDNKVIENENIKNIRYINKPKKIFMTKCCIKKKRTIFFF